MKKQKPGRPKKTNYPYWAFPNRRAWQNDCRRRIRAAIKALDVARNGSAFYPKFRTHLTAELTTLQIGEIKSRLKAQSDAMRRGVWK